MLSCCYLCCICSGLAVLETALFRNPEFLSSAHLLSTWSLAPVHYITWTDQWAFSANHRIKDQKKVQFYIFLCTIEILPSWSFQIAYAHTLCWWNDFLWLITQESEGRPLICIKSFIFGSNTLIRHYKFSFAFVLPTVMLRATCLFKNQKIICTTIYPKLPNTLEFIFG